MHTGRELSTRAGAIAFGLTLAGCDPTSGPQIAVEQATAPSLFSFHQSSWSAPVNLGAPVNSPANEQNAVLSPDELSLYFVSNRAGGLGGNDIWIAQRSSKDSPWGIPLNAGTPVNSSAAENSPSFSVDGHLLVFASERPGGQGSSDIYFSRRTNKHDDFAWQAPVNLGPDVNTTAFEAGAIYLQSVEDGRTNLYFVRGPIATDLDIYAASVNRKGETLGPAVAVTELNSPLPGVSDAHPSVRKDGREVLFHSTRPGGLGSGDMYASTRGSVHEPWSPPVNLGSPMNSVANDGQPSLSFDGRTVVFFSNRPGGLGTTDIWMSTRPVAGN